VLCIFADSSEGVGLSLCLETSKCRRFPSIPSAVVRHIVLNKRLFIASRKFFQCVVRYIVSRHPVTRFFYYFLYNTVSHVTQFVEADCCSLFTTSVV
jgi:hypothetical protein